MTEPDLHKMKATLAFIQKRDADRSVSTPVQDLLTLIARLEAAEQGKRDAEARAEKAEAGLRAVQDLIDDSYGVTGLHRNGDVAPWDSLLEGGYFEDWLRDFSIAITGLEARDDSAD